MLQFFKKLSYGFQEGYGQIRKDVLAGSAKKQRPSDFHDAIAIPPLLCNGTAPRELQMISAE